MDKEICCDCKKIKLQAEFMVGEMISIRCNECRNKLIKKELSNG